MSPRKPGKGPSSPCAPQAPSATLEGSPVVDGSPHLMSEGGGTNKSHKNSADATPAASTPGRSKRHKSNGGNDVAEGSSAQEAAGVDKARAKKKHRCGSKGSSWDKRHASQQKSKEEMKKSFGERKANEEMKKPIAEEPAAAGNTSAKKPHRGCYGSAWKQRHGGKERPKKDVENEPAEEHANGDKVTAKRIGTQDRKGPSKDKKNHSAEEPAHSDEDIAKKRRRSRTAQKSEAPFPGTVGKSPDSSEVPSLADWSRRLQALRDDNKDIAFAPLQEKEAKPTGDELVKIARRVLKGDADWDILTYPATLPRPRDVGDAVKQLRNHEALALLCYCAKTYENKPRHRLACALWLEQLLDKGDGVIGHPSLQHSLGPLWSTKQHCLSDDGSFRVLECLGQWGFILDLVKGFS